MTPQSLLPKVVKYVADPLVEGCCGGGVMEAVVFNMVLYSLLGDGVIAIAGPRVIHTRFRKSPVTDLQL